MKDAIYFPILRGRRGEIHAVAGLRSSTKVVVRPMFDVPNTDEEGEPAVTLSGVTMDLAKTWGTRLPLYLDLSRHEPDERVGESAAVVHLFNCARQAGLLAIPVSAPVRDRYGTTGAYIEGIAAIADQDKRGIALRVDYDYFTELDSLEEVINESLRAAGAADENVDIFLDCGPIDKLPLADPRQKSLMAAYSTALITLEGRPFRNIVICASGIPRKVNSIQAGVPHRVANTEFIVWNQIVGNKSTRAIRFSDYGARYAHQKDGGGGSRPPARIHLTTTERHHLYLDEPQLYRELCNSVVQNEEFFEQSWGTRAVRDCARGNGNYGGATEWVERDTYMHIETMAAATRDRLNELGVFAKLEFAQPDGVPLEQQELLPTR
jgi:hypothetical protein